MGVHVNGEAWDGLFRDRVDGTEDGSTLGYELTGRADQTETLPWINVNQLIVEFDGAVSSVDASDFELAGTPGIKDGVFADIPAINSVTPVGSTVILGLSHALEPAVLDLQVNASGISRDEEIFRTDMNYTFRALPGDVIPTLANQVQTSDLINVLVESVNRSPPDLRLQTIHSVPTSMEVTLSRRRLTQSGRSRCYKISC